MKKFLLSIFTVLAACSLANATEVTYDFTNPTSLNPVVTPSETPSSGIEVGGKTFISGSVTIAIKDGSTSSKIWTGSANASYVKDLRVYAGATLTIATTGSDNITSIVFDGSALSTTTKALYSFDSGSYDINSKTWTGSAKTIVMSITATTKINTIKVTYGASTPVTVATPTFTPAAGTYYESQSVAIACATAGIDNIYYTTDGTDPISSSTKAVYSAPITVDKTMTLKAVAISGSDASAVASADYTISIPVACNTVAEYLALADNTMGIINAPLTTVYQNGSNLYVVDAAGTPLLIFGSISKTYNNGDVIPAGVMGTKTPYYGNIELVAVASSFKAATAGTANAPLEVTTSDITVAHLNKYVKLSGVKFTLFTSSSKGFTLTQGTNTFAGYNSFGIDGTTGYDVTKVYDMTAIVGCHTAAKTDNVTTLDKMQIIPIAISNITTGVAGVDTNAVKVIGGVGEINVIGAAQNIAVYSVGGAQISANAASVNCTPGLYIVVVDGKATKVSVK